MQVAVDNILINHDILGSKNRKTILLLHGWGHNLMLWKEVALVLSEKYKVVLLDLPGFGSSSNPPESYGVNEYASVVFKFMEKLNLKKPFAIIGHSVGGKIVINLCANHNNVSEKLFLISPSGLEKRNFSTKVKVLVFKLLKYLIFFAPKNVKQSVFNLFASADYRNAGSLRENFKKIISYHVDQDAKRISIPTVIIWGDKDREVMVENSKRLKRLIPNSTLRILWGMGHSPHIENPRKLTNLLFEYL